MLYTGHCPVYSKSLYVPFYQCCKLTNCSIKYIMHIKSNDMSGSEIHKTYSIIMTINQMDNSQNDNLTTKMYL